MTRVKRLVRSLSLRPGPLRRVAIVAACVVCATGLRFLAHPLLANSAPFVTFFPALLIASVWGGMRAGIATLLIGAVVAEFFWLEPAWDLGLTRVSAAALVAYLVAGAAILFCAYLLRTAVDMARQAEAQAGLIAREMQHRIGNKLALVQAIARLSARHARTVEEFSERFDARLRAMSEAQAVLAPGPDQPADLDAVLRAVLRPFDEERIAFEGPDAGIAQEDRPMLALVIHELATNAIKHGSLSVPEGRVLIAWSMAGEALRIQWTETGGPPAAEPTRRGFGVQLARSAFPPSRGEVRIDYDPTGLRCTIMLAATGAATGRASPKAALAAASAAPLA